VNTNVHTETGNKALLRVGEIGDPRSEITVTGEKIFSRDISNNTSFTSVSDQSRDQFDQMVVTRGAGEQ
jgi:hypothetical protein